LRNGNGVLRLKLHVDVVGMFGRRFEFICERTMIS